MSSRRPHAPSDLRDSGRRPPGAADPSHSLPTRALFVAIANGIGAEMAPELLSEGADPLARNAHGVNALALSVSSMDFECLRILLASGRADLDQEALDELRALAKAFDLPHVERLVHSREIASASPEPGPGHSRAAPRL